MLNAYHDARAYLFHLGGQQLLEYCAGAAQHELVAYLHELTHALHAQLHLQQMLRARLEVIMVSRHNGRP